jgi:hypothetical protein
MTYLYLSHMACREFAGTNLMPAKHVHGNKERDGGVQEACTRRVSGRGVYVAGTNLMAVMHVEGNKEPHSTHDGNPSRVKVRHRVEEEGRNHTRQHRPALHTSAYVSAYVSICSNHT